jgi:fructokinase
MSRQRGQVLSLGEILIDLIASDGSTDLEHVSSFDVRPGGAPANVAAALSRLGVPAAFCGVVGGDPFGDKLLAALRQEGVDSSRLRRDDEQNTTLAFAWKDNRGDGHFRLLRMADTRLSPSDVERAGIEQLAAIVVGSVSLAEEPSRSAIYRAVEIARQAGVPVCFDANIRPTLWANLAAALDACLPVLERSNLIKVSLDDAAALFGSARAGEDAVRSLSRFPARFAVITDGSRGSWYAVRVDGRLVCSKRVPAFSIDAVDPTGAGDAFTAATVARLIRNAWSGLSSADIAYASAAGALATTRRGAMASLPRGSEVEAFLREHQS